MSDSNEVDMASQPDPHELPEPNVKLHREDTDSIAVTAAVAADEVVSDNPTPEPIFATDEASALKGLTENVRDQDELERDITYQANLVMIEKEDERDQKRIDKTNAAKEKLLAQKRTAKHKLERATNNVLMRPRIELEIETITADIAALENDIAEIRQRIDERHQNDGAMNDAAEQVDHNKRMPNESQRDFLIRTGKITPFSRMPIREAESMNGGLDEALMGAEEDNEMEQVSQEEAMEPRSHQNLRLPGFTDATDSGVATPIEDEFSLRPRKKRMLGTGGASPGRSSGVESGRRGRKHSSDEESSFESDDAIQDLDEFDDIDEDDDLGILAAEGGLKRKKGKKNIIEEQEDLSGVDDGNEKVYQARLQDWVKRRSHAREQHRQKLRDEGVEVLEDDLNEKEWFKPHPEAPDHHFENGLKLPGDVFPALFDYQKTGVQWLGELFAQQVGGIVGDEMGLGKTIQIISFIAGLHYSKKLTKPVIVVAPATVLTQWVNEFHKWWPALRVSILHTSGSGMLNVRNEGRIEDKEELYNRGGKKATKSSKAAERIVNRVVQQGHILVTTYAGLQTYNDILTDVDWEYAVLDEGHKIRNPNTAITIYCKELRTPNRVILSGTPMQNNLIELWSLFDFIYPMRLGTLVNFRNQFEVPIKLGGYANATNLQVMTATKCAETLKDAISPYLLQRIKADVASDLPKKSEQVLFCKLTKPQREAYEVFLASDEMTSIMNRQRQSLYGIDILRKICNHPDLLDPKLRNKPGYKWGNPHKSGKMQVVKALLEMWKKFGHKTLLFSQGVQMLNIIEEFVKNLDGFKYLRMDGGTPIKDRQRMVDQFNNDPDLHVFLLTTKVGGLGVNLTGANRVIIFDPDWNPSTDVQARERAWRLGQKKEVTIYRLMSAGTIEEKIYHRQIFKQFLTNKILRDPKQRQTFQMKDLYDLFTLGSNDDGTTETGEMFKGTEVQFQKSKESHPVTEYASHRGNWGDEPEAPIPSGYLNDGISWGGAEPDPIIESNGDNNVELRGMAGVAKLEAFKNSEEDEKNDSTHESRLMSGLFARSGVHSALEHDEIINGKKKIAPDFGILEREAKRIAAEAARELKKAGEAARNVPIGTVTWTGEFGEAGRPQSVRRRGAGPSSASVLNNLAERQGLSSPRAGTPGSSRGSTPGSASKPRGKDFLKLIRDYIARQGGSVPSQMLVVHFNPMCRTPRETAEFKAMLDQVAVLKKGTGGRMRGRWELREDFK
jgi:DNA excision repair protein ERCC-6